MRTFFAFCENNCRQRERFRYDERATTSTMKTLPDIKPYTSILVVEAQRQAKVAALKQRIRDMIDAE